MCPPDCHRWIILDKTSDFRTATLPSGVIYLFNHILYSAFICKNLSQKLSSSHSFKLLVNQRPSILNLGGFQSICKFGIYLMGEFLLLWLSSHIALVFPAFKKSPDLFPNVLIILTVSSNEFLSPSNIISVSSAYCEILYSVSPIKIPLIFLFCLIIVQGSRCLLEICVNWCETLRILCQWHEKCVQYKPRIDDFLKITGKDNLTVFSYSGRVKSPEWRRQRRRADLRQFQIFRHRPIYNLY